MTSSADEWRRIAAEYGTPFYWYDLDQAALHLKTLQANLPECVSVYYCVKANPNLAVLRVFRDLVPGLDISSAGEIELAERAGWQPGVMSFAGPGKTDAELKLAIERGVGSLSIESRGELERLCGIARSLERQVSVLIRVNPLSAPRAFAMKMGGGPSQFGVPEEEAEALLSEACRQPELRVRGIHVFSGTQCLDLPSLGENLNQTLEIARRLAETSGLTFEEVNLGGGVGIAYFEGQQDLDPQAVGRVVAESVVAFCRAQPRFSRTRFVLELGRYLMGAFGRYIAQVVEVKEARERRFVVLDGGMNHCFPATGNFGQLIKKNYPVVNLSRETIPSASVKQEIVGPLCTPMDSLARSIELPLCEVGDLLAFDRCGAYSFTASPLLFLSHRTPLELMVYKNELSVARPRRSPLDFC